MTLELKQAACGISAAVIFASSFGHILGKIPKFLSWLYKTNTTAFIVEAEVSISGSETPLFFQAISSMGSCHLNHILCRSKMTISYHGPIADTDDMPRWEMTSKYFPDGKVLLHTLPTIRWKWNPLLPENDTTPSLQMNVVVPGIYPVSKHMVEI